MAADAPRLHGARERGLDQLALPPRGEGVDRDQDLLAGVRIALVLLAMFMLSEAVLSVERTGLPYLTILIDDSASQRIADQYEKPEVKTALDDLAAAARQEAKGKTAAPPAENADDPARHRQGLDLEGPGPAAPRAGEAAQGPALPGLERGPAAGRGRSPGRRRAGGRDGAGDRADR